MGRLFVMATGSAASGPETVPRRGATRHGIPKRGQHFAWRNCLSL